MSRERPSPGTLGNEAFKLLSKTAFYEDPTLPRSHANRHTKRIGGRRLTTVGLPYSEILEMLKRKFPKAEVTVGCLRWYVSKIREGEMFLPDGLELPRRRPQSPAL
jgi:hypothetical protein